jgi:hypothetical protein
VTNWKILSWKQKDAVKISLKSNNGRMSLRFLEENIYSDDEKALKAIKKLRRNGFLEKTGIGNKYKVVEDKVPADAFEEI